MKDKVKIISVFGTRPEAVKMAPLVKEIEKYECLENIVCVTAQHREMLDQVLDYFNIKPKYDLDIMKPNQTLSMITSNILSCLDEILKKESPDLVLVHGDTTTSFSAALSAFYNKIPVGHVEAGLRSGNIKSPFPEELNRILTGNIAALHFSPTQSNAENLKRENITENVYVTGNTVIDALLSIVRDNYIFKNDILNTITASGKKTILMTIHRRENLGEPMKNIFEAVKEIALTYNELQFVYPVHKNPLVQNSANSILSGIKNIYLIDPLEIDDMHNMMSRCFFILTDSGGLQEEAPALGKPVLVCRTETERPEAVIAGTVKISGVIKSDIIKDMEDLISNNALYEKMARAVNPYGNGDASKTIVNIIKDYFIK